MPDITLFVLLPEYIKTSTYCVVFMGQVVNERIVESIFHRLCKIDFAIANSNGPFSKCCLIVSHVSDPNGNL